jgi:hypothetical protein
MSYQQINQEGKMKTESVVRVIFRKYNKGGDVVAFFPDLKGYNYYITSYQHVGQHGDADYNHCLTITKPATETEYKDLYDELKGIGYNMKVVKKVVNR